MWGSWENYQIFKGTLRGHVTYCSLIGRNFFLGLIVEKWYGGVVWAGDDVGEGFRKKKFKGPEIRAS